jgi:hypothetical protein
MSQTSGVEFKRNPRQERAFKAFVEFVLNPACPPPMGDQLCTEYDRHLDELLFEVLEALFFQNLVPVHGPTCPLDLVLMLLWLKKDGSAIRASGATHDCAVVQYWAYTTVIHALRLRLDNFSKYRQLEPTGSLSSNNLDDGSQARNFQKCVRSLLYRKIWPDIRVTCRWLNDELRQYISPQNGSNLFFTPFTRVKFFWLKAAKAAANE